MRDRWRRLSDAIGGIGVAVLTVTIVALAVYGGLFTTAMLRQFTWEHLIALLFLWQTQTGAALAVAAALIGASAVVRQTAATDRRADERRERRASALRAVLPLMLAELSDYAARCAEIFGETLRNADEREGVAKLPLGVTGPFRHPSPPGAIQGSDWPIDHRIPPLPSGLTEQLTDLIETIPPDHARPLVNLIKCVQVQHSRAETWQRDIPSGGKEKLVVRANLITSLIDACEVHARCDALYPYARGNSAQPPATISASAIGGVAFYFAPGGLLPDEVAVEIDRLAATSTWPD